MATHKINFNQIVEGVQCPEDYFSAPKRPFTTILTIASQEKFKSDLNVFPEDLHVKREVLTKLFMKPILQVSRRIKGRGGSDEENNRSDFWEDEFDITCMQNEQYFDNDPVGSPKADGQELQLVKDRPDVGSLVVDYARVSKKVNIKTLKQSIWRFVYHANKIGRKEHPETAPTPEHPSETVSPSESSAMAAVDTFNTQVLEETLEQPDRGVRTHTSNTTFKSTMIHISNDSRQKDDLSVPFAFMALLHLANVKSLRFVPMTNVEFGSDFQIFADQLDGGQ